MSVQLDGSTLSALLFNHFNGDSNQYGFLTGEKIEHIEDRISDSQIHAYDVNSYIYVSSFLPWPHGESTYSRGGNINDEWVKQLFSDRQQNLVGWYSSRHNTTSRPSLREANLHNNLAAMKRFSGQPQDFLFFLCTSSSSENMSIHTCNYGFMHSKDGCFFNLPTTVMNLGDTTRKEYRKRSSATLFHSKTIQGSLHSFQKEYLTSSGEMKHVVKIKHLSSSINDSLMSVHSKMAESEATLGLLNAEVADLRKQIDLFEQKEMEMIFQIEAENRRKKLEEEKRIHNAEDAKEQEQLQKLLIDLGMSKDMQDGSSVACNLQPELLIFDKCANEQSLGGFQVLIPTPSHSSVPTLEHVSVKNGNRNTNCDVKSSSTTALHHGKHIACEHINFVNGSEENADKSKNVQTLKNIKSDTFSFLEEGLTINLNTACNSQQTAHSCSGRSTSSPVIYNQGGIKRSALDIHELSHCKGGHIVQDLQNEGSQLKQSNTHLNDTSGCANETLANIDMREEDNEISQSDHDDKCDDKYVVSSSPVF